jgi:uncharacterized protein with von Willebrand factor type A (vWA) domain
VPSLYNYREGYLFGGDKLAVDFNDLFKNIQLSLEESKSEMSSEEQEEFYSSDDFKEYKADIKSEQVLNYNGRNVQEIFGLSGNNNTYSYNCFNFLDVDHEDYLDIVDFSPEMQETIRRGENLLPTFKYLHEDIFMSLYQFNAEIIPQERMHIQSLMNRNILSQLINTPIYIALRKACRCDMFNAGVGTEIIGKQAIEILEKEVSKIKDLQKKKEALDKLVEQEEKVDYLSEEVEELEELIEEAKMTGDTDQLDELQENLDNSMLSLQEARALAEQLAEDCEELVETSDNLVDNVVEFMEQSIDTATSEVQEVSQYVQAWGLGEGSDIKVPFGVKKSVLESIRNSDYLKKFTDMIGKYKETAIEEQKKKSKNSAIEIKSIKSGKKIEDALPSDKLNLCNEVTKKDFYRRMTQGQLMAYDKESQKQKNKGPIIICVDLSGSMHGEKSDWAKALTVGVLEVAQLQKREFACIPYDSSIRKVIKIHKDEIDPEKIIDIAQMMASGGTDFQKPLEESLKMIDESEFKEADVVFITDGDCYVSDDFRRKFRQKKEDKDFRVLGILVDYGHNCKSSLDDFCDSVTRISDFSTINSANSDVNKMIFSTL